MIVNVCPSSIAGATPERVWRVLTRPEQYGQWLQHAEVVDVRPQAGRDRASASSCRRAGWVATGRPSSKWAPSIPTVAGSS
ncbi:MAG: SRPBCC domain-containing protein [Chloroflexi bacterium]|nr:SRPBCC domain-containing protein [Chloroflexota bacterium]